jgi:hypothetical protein
VARIKRAELHKGSQNPVKLVISRDRIALNNLGIALTGAGITVAFGAWIAKFTSKSVPWWPVIVGLGVFVTGLILAIATVTEIKAANEDHSGSQRGTVGDTEPGQVGREQRPEALTGQRERTQADIVQFLPNAQIEPSTSYSEVAHSDEAENENQIATVSPLPAGTDFHSRVSRLLQQFENLEEAPSPPRRTTEDAVFQWKLEVAAWIQIAQSTLDSALELAKAREREEQHPSARLAQSVADARGGLEKMQFLIYSPGIPADSVQVARISEDWTKGISGVVRFAVGS